MFVCEFVDGHFFYLIFKYKLFCWISWYLGLSRRVTIGSRNQYFYRCVYKNGFKDTGQIHRRHMVDDLGVSKKNNTRGRLGEEIRRGPKQMTNHASTDLHKTAGEQKNDNVLVSVFRLSHVQLSPSFLADTLLPLYLYFQLLL